MKKNLRIWFARSLCGAILLAPAVVLAQPADLSPVSSNACQVSYRFDSYGAGLVRGFTGERGNVPKLIDVLCYKLGEQRGEIVRNSSCAADFGTGLSAGRAFAPGSSGSVCYREGYLAGNALVRIAAREGNVAQVGAQCVLLYRDNYTQGYSRTGQAFPVSPPLLRECAMAGYHDGGWFNVPNIDSLLVPL